MHLHEDLLLLCTVLRTGSDQAHRSPGGSNEPDRDGAGLTDRELLEEHIRGCEDAALAALVRRHGPMVWGVCRRVLHNDHDAEDAFQATFLVFVRRAASIASRDLVANWLYRVAYQTARKARATAAKRKGRETQVTEMPEPATPAQDFWCDLQPLLDQELNCLPNNYRIPIILCDLGGNTRKEVARQLGWPEGTVTGRLARARVMLAKRLARHGLAVSGGALATVLSQNAALAGVPASVVSSTINAATLFAAGQAAAGAIPARVAALTQGVLKTMFLMKLKIGTAILLVVIALGGAWGLICQSDAAEQPKTQNSMALAGEKKQRAKKQRVAKSDTERFQGNWTIVSGTYSGEDAKEVGQWSFKDAAIRIQSKWGDSKEPVRAHFLHFRLDESTNPKRIDLMEWEDFFDAAPVVEYEGIYSIDGDSLTICFGLKGSRPTTFKSMPDVDDALMVFRRHNPKTDQKR